MSLEYMEQCDHLVSLIDQEKNISLVKLDNKNLFIQEQQLATNWGIGLTEASNTLKVTTQKFIRSALHHIERRFRTKI